MTKFLFTLFLCVCLNVQAQEKSINWVSIEEAQKLQIENPTKSIFIDVYTDWCGYCKQMDNTTFQDDEVVSFINEYFIPVKFDAEHKENINFHGQEYEYIQMGNNGVHKLAVALLQGSLSYPSYVVLNAKGQLTNIFRGYMKPDALLNSF